MKKRNPITVLFLIFITLGIYGIVWSVKTKNEMNKMGADIPTAWLMIVPFVSIYWTWKYCEGIEKVTKGRLSGILSFVIFFLIGFIGYAIFQSEFNKIDSQLASDTPMAPAAYQNQPQPDNSFGGATGGESSQAVMAQPNIAATQPSEDQPATAIAATLPATNSPEKPSQPAA